MRGIHKNLFFEFYYHINQKDLFTHFPPNLKVRYQTSEKSLGANNKTLKEASGVYK